MTLGLAYWIVVIIWIVGVGVSLYVSNDNWKLWAPGLIPLILFLLLGWAVFGAPIKG